MMVFVTMMSFDFEWFDSFGILKMKVVSAATFSKFQDLIFKVWEA